MRKKLVILDDDGKKLDSISVGKPKDMEEGLKRWKLKGFL